MERAARLGVHFAGNRYQMSSCFSAVHSILFSFAVTTHWCAIEVVPVHSRTVGSRPLLAVSSLQNKGTDRRENSLQGFSRWNLSKTDNRYRLGEIAGRESPVVAPKLQSYLFAHRGRAVIAEAVLGALSLSAVHVFLWAFFRQESNAWLTELAGDKLAKRPCSALLLSKGSCSTSHIPAPSGLREV